jgi:hypothetical protein
MDRTPLVSVTPANSILNRLVKLLAHLADWFPNDGWSDYLQDGAPRWSTIRLGGFSQGGGHAAMIARDNEVARVCMLEAPVDLIGPPGSERRLPPWIVPADTTPVDRYYGFHHARSSSPNAQAFPLAWATLELGHFGPAVDIDSAAPPYDGSHYLITNAEPIDDGGPNLTHRGVVADAVTPKTPSGQPLFSPVWQYACFS